MSLTIQLKRSENQIAFNVKRPGELFLKVGRAKSVAVRKNYSVEAPVDLKSSLCPPGTGSSKNRGEEVTQIAQPTEGEEFSCDRRRIYPEEEFRTVSYSRRRNSASEISH